jgi:hypothetical protein
MKAFRTLIVLILLAVLPGVPAFAQETPAAAATPEGLFTIFGDFAGKVVGVNDITEHLGGNDVATPELASNDPVVSQMKEVADKNGLALHFVLEGVEDKSIPDPGAVVVTIRKIGGAWRVAPFFSREE